MSSKNAKPTQETRTERTSVTPADKRVEADRRAEAVLKRIRESDQMRRVLTELSKR
jgi:hypothetical protein